MSVIDHFKKLKEDVAQITSLYEKVQISYVYHQPETKEVNCELVIIDKTETKVDIKKEDVNGIITAIESFRKKYLLINKLGYPFSTYIKKLILGVYGVS